MDTKLRGDIAEQAVLLEALKRGWGVLRPVGDRFPYDVVFDINGVLVKVQVKCAWYDNASKNYTVDVRRTKTNRRIMKRALYRPGDFHFALVYLPQLSIFYVFPYSIFRAYGSSIAMVEEQRRQRKPMSARYRDAWELIAQWATRGESRAGKSVKFGGTSRAVVIPPGHTTGRHVG